VDLARDESSVLSGAPLYFVRILDGAYALISLDTKIKSFYPWARERETEGERERERTTSGFLSVVCIGNETLPQPCVFAPRLRTLFK